MSAFVQVTGLLYFWQAREVLFEFMPLNCAPGSVPPAGFEPALTAPEAVAVHRSDLAFYAQRGALGGVWGAETQA